LLLAATASLAELPVFSPQAVAGVQSEAALLGAVPRGMTATMHDGSLQINRAPISGQYVPSYSLLDSSPGVSGGALVPFDTIGPTGLSPSQVRQAYGINQVMFGSVTGDGTGQTIAIVDAYDYPTISTDLHNFDVAFGLPDPPSVTRVNETGGSTLPGTDPSGKGNDWEIEEALDVEWSHAMAPGASIVLVEASAADDPDLIADAANTARNLSGVVAVTMSFGETESATETSDDQYFTTPSGHAGVTFLASTGDSGEPGCYPAFSPNVIAVGGTTLNIDSSGNYLSESGWSDSGGGISAYETQPAFQKGVVTQSTTQRTIPDVAFDADPNTGVSIYDSYDYGTSAPWLAVGGTSVASPCWAGIVSVVDQGRTLAGSGSLDGSTKTLPQIYALPASAIHDITTGNNGYAAGVGYDLVTGRGSPVANILIPKLVSASPVASIQWSTIPSPQVAGLPFTATLTAENSTGGVAASFNGTATLSGVLGTSAVSITPTTVTFVSGVWTGNITVTQAATGMHLHADDGNGDLADSNVFTVSPQTSSLSLPGNITEGQGTLDGTITVAPAPTSNLVVDLTSSDPTRLTVPAVVTIVAGQTSAVVPITVIDDNLLNGPEAVTITATSTGYTPTSAVMHVHDNETAVLTVSLPATTIEGAAPITGTITSSAAPSDNITVALSSSLTSSLTVPATVTLLAGQTTVTFTATVIDNHIIDGGNNVTVTASVENWTSGSATINVADNDTYVAVSLPAGGWEGQTLTNAGTVTLGGTLTTPLVVNLASDNSSLTVPSSVTVPAGQTSAAFNLTFLTDSLQNGDRTAHVTATATGMTAGSSALVIHDSNVSYLAIAPITGSESANVAFTATVTAYNIANEVIAVYAGSGTLSASGQSGTLPISPTSITFAAGVWTGSVTIAAEDPAARITATSGVATGTSNAFTVLGGAVVGFTWSTIASPEVAGLPFTTTLTARDANGQVANFSGSATVSGLIGTTTSQTMLGSPAYDYYGTSSAGWTDGYSFTPNTSIQVTALRSYFGTKFDIWTNTGTLLASQAVSGTPTVWTETPLASPITLSANTTYRISVYTPAGKPWYYKFFTPSNPTFATLGQTYQVQGDGFPTHTDEAFWLVDLRGNVGAFTSVPVSPTTVTFASGVWTGSITMAQTGTGVHLHVDDGTGQTGDSNTFNVIAQSAFLSLPTNMTEGQGTLSGTYTVTPAATSAVTVSLASSDPSRLTVPATVTVQAGQTSVAVPVTVIQTNQLDGPEAVTVTATASGYATLNATVNVHSNQTAVLSLSIPFNTVEGAASLAGTVVSSMAPAQNITVALSSSLTSSLTVPASVVILAGQYWATFTATVIDNHVIDGGNNVLVTASVENWTSGTAKVFVADADNNLTVTMPAGGWEGQTLTSAGTVTLGGTLTTPLVVNLASDNSSLAVPSTVTIPAGQTSATFNLTFLSDNLENGDRTAHVTATAAGMISGTSGVLIHDANVAYLKMAPIAGPQTADVAFATTVTAYNIANEPVIVYAGSATLSAAGLSGTLPITPSSIAFTAGVWTGNVTIAGEDSAAQLTATTAGGATGTSNVFAVQGGAVAGFTWGTPPSTEAAGVPFAARITAWDVNGFVAGFSGSAGISAYVPGISSQTFLNSPAPTNSAGGVSYTWGYPITPNASLQVTAVRSYFGTKVDIWSSTGMLLASQPVNGTPATWTETQLAAPVTLTAGATYYVTTYTGAQTYYWTTVTPPNPSFATIGSSVFLTGDGFPAVPDLGTWPLVDLRVNVPSFVPVSVAPNSIAFSSGVWTGNITVPQVESSLHLHVDDGNGHTADSGIFSVIAPLPAPSAPVLTAASDSGASNSDDITNLNNSTPARALAFSVAGVTAGATVTLYADSQPIGSAVAAGTTVVVTTNGTATLGDGQHSFTASQSLSGLQFPASQPVLVTIDTVPPVITINSLVTTNTAPALGGTINDPSASVTVLVNGFTYVATNNGNGAWTLPVNAISPLLVAAVYPITATATDIAGNSNSTSGSLTIQQPISLSANLEYLRLDPDGLHVDIWNNATASGAPGESILASSISTVTYLGPSGGDIVVLDFSNGDPLPTGGISLSGGAGQNTLEIIGSRPGNNAAVAISGGSFSIPASAANSANAGTQNNVLGTVSIAAGAELALAPSDSQADQTVLSVNNLVIAGTLDITNNTLLANEAKVAESQIATWVQNAPAAPCIMSSLVIGPGAVANRAVGYGDWNQDPLSVPAGDVEVKYTVTGDTNLDGVVDQADLARAINNLGQSPGYYGGDVANHGIVDIDDIAEIINNLGDSLSATGDSLGVAASGMAVAADLP